MPAHRTAINLPVGNHRIHKNAAILDNHIVENFRMADLDIDRNDRSVRGMAECARIYLGT